MAQERIRNTVTKKLTLIFVNIGNYFDHFNPLKSHLVQNKEHRVAKVKPKSDGDGGVNIVIWVVHMGGTAQVFSSFVFGQVLHLSR